MISPESLSFSAIKTDLETYIKSLSDYETTWKDFYEGGAGQTVLDVGSGIAAFLSFAAYLNRRDTMLNFGQLPSTVVSIGAALGYHYNRSVAPKMKITFVSDSNVFWDKLDPIGTYKGISICLLESTQINKGTNTITVVVGDWVTYSYTATETKDFTSMMVEGDIDNVYLNLRVNDSIVDIVIDIEQLKPTSVQLRSYLTGVFLIFGNGQLGRKLTVNDVLDFEYIKPAGVLAETIISSSDVQVVLGSVVTEVITLDPGSNPDTTDKIVAVAPGYYATKRRLISLADYKAIGSAYQGIASANARKSVTGCCAVDVAYVRFDQSIMTPSMKVEYYNYMMQYAMLGNEIKIVDPIYTYVDLSVKIVVTRKADTAAIRTQVMAYLNSMCMKLGQLFTPSGLWSLDIPEVIRPYVNFPIIDRQAKWNQYFVLRSADISFTTDTTVIWSGGTDPTLGYEDYVQPN